MADGPIGQADTVLEVSPPSATQAMFYHQRAALSGLWTSLHCV